MRRSVFASAGVIFAVACAAAAPADPIKTKLDKARVAYETDLAAIDKAQYAEFDKAAAAARKAGDKAALDRIREQRERFELTGAFPMTGALSRRVDAARKAFYEACETAVREYTKASKDAEAAAVEKEHVEVARGPVLPRYFLIVNKNSGLVLTAKDKGEPGSVLVQAERTGAADQLWWFSTTGINSTLSLTNKASRLYASVNEKFNPGDRISLEKETRGGGYWNLERDGFDILLINNSGKLCVEVPNGSKNAGAEVVQARKADKADHQRWTLVPAKPK